MLLKRFYHDGLAQSSYLIGCQRTGESLVVDANRDFEVYLDAAQAANLRITHVTETHIHADYLSGSRELAEITGARLLLSAEGGQDWQYGFARESGASYLQDGDSFAVGNVRVEAMHTPGHTPEHLIFLATDTMASSQPVGALTGDFIFAGDVGRPDLLERAAGVEGTMRAGAKLLFESLRRFTERCPDYLQLWPGHGAGSACGKALGEMPQTTLGYEKLTNWAFQIDREEPFVEAVLTGQPDPPRYFATMKRMNREGPAKLHPRRDPEYFPADRLAEVIGRGAIVLDIRPASDFAAQHVPGTITLPLTRRFASLAGWVLPYDQDLFLLTGDNSAGGVLRAARDLAMIGLDRVTGWFDGSAIAGWSSSAGTLASLKRVPVEQASEHMSRGARVVDVRSTAEWSSGRIPGALFAPLGRLVEQLASEPRQQRLLLVCESGGRSAIGVSLLQREGFTEVADLAGGMSEWRRLGLPLEKDTLIQVAR